MIPLRDLNEIRLQYPDGFWLTSFVWMVGNKRATSVLRPTKCIAGNGLRVHTLNKNDEPNYYSNLYKSYSSLYAFRTEQEAIDYYQKAVLEQSERVEEQLKKELVAIRNTRDRYFL